MSTFTAKHLEVVFGQLQDCCLHNPAWTPADVADVPCSVWNGDESGGWADCQPVTKSYDNWKRGTESSSYTVARLKDGQSRCVAAAVIGASVGSL